MPRRSPTRRRACSARATPSSTPSPWPRRPAHAVWCWSPTSTASARPTGPTRAACSRVCAPTFRARQLLARNVGAQTREELARAAFEGVVCGLLDGLDALARQVPADGPITLVGGGASSAAYRRILADLSGRVVRVPAEQGSTVALGAAVQAAATLEETTPEAVRAAWRAADVEQVEPDPAAERDAVREAYAARREEGVANPG